MDNPNKPVAKSLKLFVLLALLALITWTGKRWLLSPPSGVNAMQPVNVDSFVGPWYEIARSPNRFEAGMNPVQIFLKPAAPSDKGKTYEITLIGAVEGEDDKVWKQKAIWSGENNEEASLAVPCGLWLFKCGLHIIASGKPSANWLLVSGPTKGFWWILASTPGLKEDTFVSILKDLKEMGFDTDPIVLTKNKLPAVPQMPKLPFRTPIPLMPARPPVPGTKENGQSALRDHRPPPMPAAPPPMPAAPPPMPAAPPPMPAAPPPMPAAPPPMP